MPSLRMQWVAVGAIALATFLTIQTLVSIQMPSQDRNQGHPDLPRRASGVFAAQAALRMRKRAHVEEEEKGDIYSKKVNDLEDADQPDEAEENSMDSEIEEETKLNDEDEEEAEDESEDEDEDEAEDEDENEFDADAEIFSGDGADKDEEEQAEVEAKSMDQQNESREVEPNAASDADEESRIKEKEEISKKERRSDKEETANKVHKKDSKNSKEDGARVPKKKMNVLILYPDDWRHDTIGGVAPVVRTPFLNELARDGVRFTHNCVTTSICWISRATMFTGQYAARHQTYLLKAPVPFVSKFNRTWAGILQHEHGYHVGHMGKWQFWNEPGEAEALFSEAIFSGGYHWDTRDGKPKHDADVAKDDALDFLERRPKDKPFALTVAFYPPKAIGESTEPGVPPPREDIEASFKRLPWFFKHEWVGRNRYFQRFDSPEKYQAAMKNYYRLVYSVDEACRTLVDKLKEQGVFDDTLIIFTTDNGLFHGEHGLAGKWYPFQESIRVPLIIRDPRMPKNKRNTLDDSFTLNIDLAETILGAAGVEPDHGMQGRDISDRYMKNPKSSDPWRDEFYYEWTPKDGGAYFPSATALVRKKWKYMYWPEYKYEQLFDMVNDPLEENDVAKEEKFASILSEMRKRHNELRDKVV